MASYRLTENKLRGMIREAVKGALREDAYEMTREVDSVFNRFGTSLGKLLEKYSVDEVADRKIGRLVHALHNLVVDSINGRDDSSTWGIDTLDI